MSTNSWVLAVINLILSCWGAHLATVLLRGDSEDSNSSCPHLAMSDSVDIDIMMDSDRRSSILKSAMYHVDAFVGIITFLLSTILNFGSVYLRGTYTSIRLQNLPATSVAWTFIVMYSPSPLQVMYMACGMMNLVGLVSMYRWWQKERMGYTGIRPSEYSIMEEGRSVQVGVHDASDEKVVVVVSNKD